MPKTRARQNIEQIAHIIREGLEYGTMTVDEARRINDGDGWTFTVRYRDEDYTNRDSYTKIENLTLSPSGLESAIKLALEK